LNNALAPSTIRSGGIGRDSFFSCRLVHCFPRGLSGRVPRSALLARRRRSVTVIPVDLRQAVLESYNLSSTGHSAQIRCAAKSAPFTGSNARLATVSTFLLHAVRENASSGAPSGSENRAASRADRTRERRHRRMRRDPTPAHDLLPRQNVMRSRSSYEMAQSMPTP